MYDMDGMKVELKVSASVEAQLYRNTFLGIQDDFCGGGLRWYLWLKAAI